MLWGTRKVAPAGGPAMCQALCWGATHMSAHLLCSVPLSGRWHPPYPADEIQEAQREEACPVTQLVYGRAGIQTQLCLIPKHLLFFFFFFSLRRKINGDFLGFLPSSQMSLSCQRQCAPDTSSFLLILGPACLCGGGRAGVALESARWYSAPPLVSDSVWLE